MASLTSVTFLSRGLTIAGHLYTPPANSPDRNNAAIVVGHPTTGVKEQAAGLYSRLLAEAGFVTLAFDAGYQGDSGGEPHGLEDPSQRVEDFKAAVTYLSVIEQAGVQVDRHRIGILGICASGGYVSFAAQTDKRMRAVATISAGCMGENTRNGMRGSPPSALVTPEMLDKLLLKSGEARTTAARTEEIMLLPLLPDRAEDLPTDLPENSTLIEAWDYYKTPRGGHPQSAQKEVAWSADMRANYDSFAFNYLISPRPLLMIIGSEADSGYMSRMGIEKAKEPKELYVIPGQSHVGLYDDTSVTLPKLVEFMEKNLCH